jgi:glycosyltransferase involved in cell wall biosynthesis
MASQLGAELAARGSVVAFCSPGGEPFESWLQARGIDVFGMVRPRPTPIAQALAARRIAAAIVDFKPDIVHAHNPATGMATAIARRLSGVSPGMVTTYHGVSDKRLRRTTTIFRWIPGVVVGCGPAAASELRRGGVQPTRLFMVENGIDTARHDFGSIRAELKMSSRPMVVNVGRCVAEKNQRFLLDVAAVLRARASLAQIVIVGAGPLENELRREVLSRELGDTVTFAGARTDGPSFIADADVFALCSHKEGFPLTVLEAMSSGTPVVACSVRGLGDLIEHERTGLLVEPGDSDAFAEALIRAIEDKGLAAELAAAARRRVVERFSLRAMADGYSDIYDRLLS